MTEKATAADLTGQRSIIKFCVDKWHMRFSDGKCNWFFWLDGECDYDVLKTSLLLNVSFGRVAYIGNTKITITPLVFMLRHTDSLY